MSDDLSCAVHIIVMGSIGNPGIVSDLLKMEISATSFLEELGRGVMMIAIGDIEFKKDLTR